MYARSSNAKGFVHFGGDVVAGVEDGIAVHLRSASTGSTAVIEPLSDSDTAALKIRAKGAAGLTVGNASNALSVAGSALTLQTVGDIGISAANLTFKGAYSTTFTLAWSALSSGATEDFSIANTVADIMPGDLVSIGMPAATGGFALIGMRLSTASASRVTLVVGNISSTTFGATNSAEARITWIDLT